MKKARRTREVQKPQTPSARPWMNVLALMAAASRSDGGAGLHRLLRNTRWDERTRLSLLKREPKLEVAA